MIPVTVHVASPLLVNPNAGTRSAEPEKTSENGEVQTPMPTALAARGMDFVPTVLTASGGMPRGEQFQRQYWNPHWTRVAEPEDSEDHDEAMKIGPWVARKRKAFWEARFAVAVANCKPQCNARMISRSQHITD
jgi:hypothetical protein